MEDALLKCSGVILNKEEEAVDAVQSVLSFFQLKSGLRKRDGKSLTSCFLNPHITFHAKKILGINAD